MRNGGPMRARKRFEDVVNGLETRRRRKKVWKEQKQRVHGRRNVEIAIREKVAPGAGEARISAGWLCKKP